MSGSKFDSIAGRFSSIATRISASPVLDSITNGFMGTMVISIGLALVSIVVNLPIPPWQEFLLGSGISALVNDALSVTLSMLGIYVVGAIGYHCARNKDGQPLTGAVLSTAAFFLLIPLVKTETDAGVVTSIDVTYMGSKGIVMALILGILIPYLYCFLLKKNIKITLPDSVPLNVATSFEPTIVAVIIVTLLIALRGLFSMLPGGNIFDFIQTVVTAPLMGIAASPLAAILFYTFGNFVWFLGIHPSALNSVWMPVFMAANTANIEAFVSGQPIPFLLYSIIGGYCVYVGGQGNTLALAVLMPFAKSERYRSLAKLALVPSIFNINEPIIFGVPVILNPYYLVPMVLSSLIPGLVCYGVCLLGFVPAFNPAYQPGSWTMPVFLNAVLQGGVSLLALTLLAFALQIVLYYPFFRMADKAAYQEERERMEELAEEAAAPAPKA